MIESSTLSDLQDNRHYCASPEYINITAIHYSLSKKYLPKQWSKILFVKDDKGIIWLHKPMLTSRHKREQLDYDISQSADAQHVVSAVVGGPIGLWVLICTIVQAISYQLGALLLTLGGLIVYYRYTMILTKRDMAHVMLENLVKKSK